MTRIKLELETKRLMGKPAVLYCTDHWHALAIFEDLVGSKHVNIFYRESESGDKGKSPWRLVTASELYSLEMKRTREERSKIVQSLNNIQAKQDKGESE